LCNVFFPGQLVLFCTYFHPSEVWGMLKFNTPRLIFMVLLATI